MDLLDFGLKPLSDYLSGEVRSEVRRLSQRRSYGDKDALHMRGDGPARLCMIVEGKVRFGRFQHDGSFKLLAMLGPGAHYGDVALQRRSFTQSVYASGPTEIEVIDAASLETLLRKHPDLALALLRCNTARLNAVLELYDDARTLNVTARLAKVIYVHLGRGGLVNGLVCLQSDLAELLGVSKVAVGKAMRELEQSGLVQCGYRQIIVPDKSKLKAWLRGSGAA
jgi:CRP/FNR family transcriptional regulator